MLRRLLLLAACLAVIAIPVELAAQTPAPTPTKPPPSKPAAPRTTRSQRAPALAVTVSVTDASGSHLAGARVSVTGPVARNGESGVDGTIRLTGFRAGTYRVRVEHEGFYTLERDITLRAGGQPVTIDMTLSRAPDPEPVEAPEPPPPAKPDVGPPGEARSVVVGDFLEKNFIGSRDPRKEDELGCTASARTRLIQLKETTGEEATPEADEVIYVVAGEGTMRLGNRDVALPNSALVIVPRGTARSLTRKGKNPLIVLSIVSGPSCTAKASER